ncbi:MAG: hypothetical protein Q8R01_10865, partial [Ramlibacter sp.]|nr:hypothetical protein [Ramlibacter sp.]
METVVQDELRVKPKPQETLPPTFAAAGGGARRRRRAISQIHALLDRLDLEQQTKRQFRQRGKFVRTPNVELVLRDGMDRLSDTVDAPTGGIGANTLERDLLEPRARCAVRWD